MKKKFTMKHILIPVGIVILILAIVAVFLSKGSTNSGYHVHEDGSTHYDNEVVESTYHVHDDGVTHYDEH